jgi:hypothetical protein
VVQEPWGRRQTWMELPLCASGAEIGTASLIFSGGENKPDTDGSQTKKMSVRQEAAKERTCAAGFVTLSLLLLAGEAMSAARFCVAKCTCRAATEQDVLFSASASIRWDAGHLLFSAARWDCRKTGPCQGLSDHSRQ